MIEFDFDLNHIDHLQQQLKNLTHQNFEEVSNYI